MHYIKHLDIHFLGIMPVSWQYSIPHRPSHNENTQMGSYHENGSYVWTYFGIDIHVLSILAGNVIWKEGGL